MFVGPLALGLLSLIGSLLGPSAALPDRCVG
jgi:hypothetical protein